MVRSQSQMSRIVGDNLVKLRWKRGLTQAQLSKRIGVSTSTINVVESGFGNPSAILLFRFSHFYQVKLDDLLLPSQVAIHTVLESEALSQRILPSRVRIQELKNSDSRLKFKGLLIPPKSSYQISSADRMIELIICHTGEVWIESPQQKSLLQANQFAECVSHHLKVIVNHEEFESRVALLRCPKNDD